MRTTALAAALVLAAGCVRSQATVTASPPPVVWTTAAGQALSRPVPVALDDQTCRQRMRMTVGAPAIRLRLSNALSPTPLRLHAVTVARPADGAAVEPGSVRPVTVRGISQIELAPGEQAVSDPVLVSVAAGEDLTVSLALAGSSRPSEHQLGASTTYCSTSGSGDLSAEPSGSRFLPAGRSELVVDDIDVTGGPTGAVLAVGDSLTDARLPPDTYQRWTDVLAEELGGRRAVVNAAVDGNRVVLPGGYGPTLEKRFERDVLARAGVRTLVMFEGTNDISAGLPAVELIEHLEALCRTAKQHGLEVVLLTFAPAERRPAAAQHARRLVNEWIRKGSPADLVVDADDVLRDPSHPTRLHPSYDLGDGLHLSAAGQRALGQAVAAALARS